MAGQMNRIENAARLAMADLGPELSARTAPAGMALSFKIGLLFAFLALTGVAAASLL